MARIKVPICGKSPYHVSARSNNRDWFDAPMSYCYDIFTKIMAISLERYSIKLHAFVLMNNHFHMLITTPQENISSFLRYFMTETSRGIRKKSNRINHIYGGRNNKTLIQDPLYYAYAYKYIIRNPVKAGICNFVDDYQWSTSSSIHSKMNALIVDPKKEYKNFIPSDKKEYLNWLNEPTPKELEEKCRKALRRKIFKIKKESGT